MIYVNVPDSISDNSKRVPGRDYVSYQNVLFDGEKLKTNETNTNQDDIRTLVQW